MAVRTISFNLPDGQEDELIVEFATFHGWTVESGVSAAVWVKAVLAEVIREGIKESRLDPAKQQVEQEVQEEVTALNIR